METVKKYAILAWEAIKSKPILFAGGVAVGYFVAKII